MEMAQEIELGLQIEIQGPDGTEMVYRPAEGQEQQQGSGTRVGWDQPGMEPVGELMRENPELANFAQEIMNNVLSKSTIQNYQGAIRKYQDFCDSVNHDRAEFSEKIILHYLTFLHKNNATTATVKQVKPAITLLLDMYGADKSVFTDRVDRWISAVLRLAAKRKPPTQKAGQVTLQDLKEMVQRVVTPHKDSIMEVHPTRFRTVIRLVIIYFTFCRLSDYLLLQARHIEEHGEDLIVTFPGAKNDQFHEGHTTVLAANGTDFCPVQLVKLYYKRFGLRFGVAHGDTTALNCVLRRSAGRVYADRQQVASISLSRQNLTELFVWVGQDPTGKTHKSVKMTGVTETLEAGVPLPEVGHQGRWLSPEMALRYKHNSLQYKRGIARRVPY
jgi:hypothetical protein